ncbi:MAG: ATP-dependent sacrificial sulfur transferase LarE [Lachnospiraceae bacterium]
MKRDMENSGWNEKLQNLQTQLLTDTKNAVGVAFSGGVDSSLLLKIACECAKKNGTKVTAFMMQTELLPIGDVDVARQVAEEAGAELFILSTDVLKEAGISNNPTDRCYLCKKTIFAKMKAEAEKRGISVLLEGTNADDLLAYRPGIRAIRELGIKSPLTEAAVTKSEVRAMAAAYGIAVADRPSSPCMATRFPYGAELTLEQLDRVKEGEEYLKGLGLYNVRLRIHGNVARIEVDGSAMDEMIKKRQEIVSCLKDLGYSYITLDLEGFRSGSMDIFVNQ